MWIRRTLLVAAFTAGTALVVAPPAAAADYCEPGYFCAYDLEDLERRLMRSNAGIGSKVDVADDRTSSGDNQTLYIWDGRNRKFGLPDGHAYEWNAGDTAYTLGEGNNKIDHFDVE